jgi:hypothetical protein
MRVRRDEQKVSGEVTRYFMTKTLLTGKKCGVTWNSLILINEYHNMKIELDSDF